MKAETALSLKYDLFCISSRQGNNCISSWQIYKLSFVLAMFSLPKQFPTQSRHKSMSFKCVVMP